MKRPVRLLSMIAAAVLVAPALAGEIVKCVDSDGHVTLTDQPCASGAATVPLAREAGAMPVPVPATRDAIAPLAQRHVLSVAELPRVNWQRPNLATPARLARDVATLKEARRMLMLQDARPRLAGFD